jgi:DNA-directed RNA polymerase specialized sigma24 family protein
VHAPVRPSAPVRAPAATPPPAPVHTPAGPLPYEPVTPEDAFDGLYHRVAGGLVRQVELLTGDAAAARRAVVRAFGLAWQRWPEVARDSDPVGWVRAAAYDGALAPWQRWVPGRPPPPPAPADPLAAALPALPPVQRRAVLLFDGLGLALPAVAAEMEASTAATAARIVRAREALAAAVAETDRGGADAQDAGAGQEPVRGPAALAALLGEDVPEPPRTPAAVREASEREARRLTAAAFALAGLMALALLVAVVLEVLEAGTGSAGP